MRLKCISYLLGYFVSLVVGHCVIKCKLMCLKEKLPGVDVGGKLGGELGVLERFIFTSCWLLNAKSFIPWWFGFKAAGNWRSWKETRENQGGINYFLIGNGLSLVFGVAGALIAEHFEKITGVVKLIF